MLKQKYIIKYYGYIYMAGVLYRDLKQERITECFRYNIVHTANF